MVCATLLLHVNILLAVYAGAGLATGARLKWDPSTYVALRELFPREYRAAAAALPTAAAALLLLAHAAAVALRTRRPALRRLLLLLYAGMMAVLVAGEVALVGWVARRAARWARSPPAAELQRALRLREHLLPLLQQLAHWHPLPSKLRGLIQEAEADAPRNLHVALAVGALLLLLQAVAVLLALLLAARRPRSPDPHIPWRDSDNTPLRRSSDKSPRVVYRAGRLVVCAATTTNTTTSSSTSSTAVLEDSRLKNYVRNTNARMCATVNNKL